MTRLCSELHEEGVDIVLTPGARLLDLADEHPELDLPFSCRAATCGTCRVELLEGAEAFAPPESEERELLEAFGEPQAVRLACQAVFAAPGREIAVIRLRVVEPW